jgi:threonine dehydratase
VEVDIPFTFIRNYVSRVQLMNGKRLDAIFACTGGGGLLSGTHSSLSMTQLDAF